MDEARGDKTESLCPVCLKRVGAVRLAEGDSVFLVKECPDHGSFRTVLWRGKPPMDEWRRPKEQVHPGTPYADVRDGCPFDCGLCAAHEQLPCSVLLEVTDRCNLHCPVCFADAGSGGASDPSLETIAGLLERAMAAVGPCNLQLSGGEPTLRGDLPDIVEIARRTGYSFIQVNTNGVRLAADIDFARRLRSAGLSSVFLQFDDVDDEVYRILRGRPLLEEKLRAVENCGEAGLGVVLVPTLASGINAGSVGAIVKEALRLVPVVRGVHFQPISYFGRFPNNHGNRGRLTLPELMRALEDQTGGLLKVADFSPPGCEHARCSFHATYVHSADGQLRAVGGGMEDGCCSGAVEAGGVRKTVGTVARRWKLSSVTPFSRSAPPPPLSACCGEKTPKVTRADGPIDLDLFLRDAPTRTLTISAMAFQDADNIDLERLRGCCISVISPDGLLIPFCAYNLTSREGKGLYRPRSGSRGEQAAHQ
jgi:uncharacterized radical SAM superfamily Fe-S cluster-containing enzyme